MPRCDCTNITPCECTPNDNCVVDRCKDCIRTASPVIMPKDSVGCSQSGFINLKPLNNYSICDGEMFHKVVRYDKNIFETAYIDDTNGKIEVNFTFTDQAVPYEFYTIHYKAVCIESGKGNFGKIQIGVDDLCKYKDCKNCDPCSGKCLDQSDISVSIGKPNNVSVTIK